MSTTSKPTTESRPSGKKDEEGNAYHVEVSPGRRRLVNLLALAGILTSLVAGFFVEAPTVWGLVIPIVMYFVLTLLGMDLLVATIAVLLSAVLLAQSTPAEVGDLLGTATADLVTIIGFIIVLGAGVGEILRRTGVADTIVRSTIRVVGEHSPWRMQLGIMLACLILVASLGTLAGALAIAAPILIPVAARIGFTRSATALMMFIGGAAGLAVAPFAGSNVAILEAADIDYLTYLRTVAGPLAILSVVLGMALIPWIQRRSKREDDFYTAEETAGDGESSPRTAKQATAVFLVLLVALVVYATWTKAGTNFPLLALPLLAIATGFAGRMKVAELVSTFFKGASKLLSMLVLFWLLAAVFLAVDALKPYDVIMANFGDRLGHMSALPFAIVIALLGWVGVPGATAAQVVLLDKVFGGVAATLGIAAPAWAIVLLWASKGDTYGPMPNANMVGAMGLARSTNLRNLLLPSWVIIGGACVMYAVLLVILT